MFNRNATKVPCELYLMKDAGIKPCLQHMWNAQSVCYASVYVVAQSVLMGDGVMVTRYASCSKCAGLRGDCDTEVYVVECGTLL